MGLFRRHRVQAPPPQSTSPRSGTGTLFRDKDCSSSRDSAKDNEQNWKDLVSNNKDRMSCMDRGDTFSCTFSTNEDSSAMSPSISSEDLEYTTTDLDVWNAVSSLPWQRESRRSKMERKRGITDMFRRRKEVCQSSAEDEIILERLMHIFSLEDWSTDIMETQDNLDRLRGNENDVPYLKGFVNIHLTPHSDTNKRQAANRNDSSMLGETKENFVQSFFLTKKGKVFDTPVRKVRADVLGSQHFLSSTKSPGAWLFSSIHNSSVSPSTKLSQSSCREPQTKPLSFPLSITKSPLSFLQANKTKKKCITENAAHLLKRFERFEKQMKLKVKLKTANQANKMYKTSPVKVDEDPISAKGKNSIQCTPDQTKRNLLKPLSEKGFMYTIDDITSDKDLQRDLSIFWTKEVVPKWSSFMLNNGSNKTMCNLWRKGLPDVARSLLWPLAMGNELKITGELFEICCQQIKQKNAEESTFFSSFQKSSLEMDIDRTIHESHFSDTLMEKTNIKRNIMTVLEAFVQYRPDVGYVQGMTYIASILLLYLDPEMAFICFVNLVSQDIFLSFFRFSSKRREHFLTTIVSMIASHLPDMSDHFNNLGITPDMYLVEWLVTLFSRSLQLECVTRLWDCYMLDGIVAIYQGTLSVLSVLKERIMNATCLEQCLPILKSGAMSISTSDFFDAYFDCNINPTDIHTLSHLTSECYSPRPVEVRSHGRVLTKVKVFPKGSISPIKSAYNSLADSPRSPRSKTMNSLKHLDSPLSHAQSSVKNYQMLFHSNSDLVNYCLQYINI